VLRRRRRRRNPMSLVKDERPNDEIPAGTFHADDDADAPPPEESVVT